MSIKVRISPFKGLKLDMLFFSDFLGYSTNGTTKLLTVLTELD